MKLCIAGKNSIAVDCLKTALAFQEKDPDLQIVVLYNRTETGQNTWQKSLQYFAGRWGVPCCSLEDIYEEENMTFLSLEYDRLLVPEKFATKQLFNIHFSLLPAYKGMYTSALPLLQGEKTVGVTLHRVDAGIDTGQIIAQVPFEVEDTDTGRSLYAKYIAHGTALVQSYMEQLIYHPDRIESRPQPAAGSTYFSRKTIDYANLAIDLKQTAQGIINQIRAFAFREYQLPRVYGTPIVWAKAGQERTFEKPGTVLEDTEGYLKLATIDYAVYLYKDRFAQLMEACGSGDLERVQEICGEYPYHNDKNERGWTPLIVATYHNRKDVVRYLVEQGADVHAVNHNGTNLLMYAKEAYKKSKDKELLRFYLSRGLTFEAEDYAGVNLYQYCEAEGLKLDAE